MLRISFLTMVMLGAILVSAQQVGIGTASPNASAQLDVFSNNKGLLLPRVALTNIFQVSPVTSPAQGLLVWNTNESIAGGQGAGFYFWSGSRWQKLSNSSEAWGLTGNSFTDTATNFIGTTDNRSLMFRVNNEQAGRIEVNGENLFFGYTAGRFNIHNTGDFTGDRNTFLGSGAGRSNVTGGSNTYVGASAGRSIVNSFGNTMVGAYAGASNSLGQFNTNIGFAAGGQIGDGSRNTALGYQAGSFMGNGVGAQGNVTVGYEAGVSLGDGAGNVIIGRHAGNGNFIQNGIGSYNVYIGDSSAPASNSAQRNVAIGRRSGRNISNGSRNVLVGDSTGIGLTVGSGNVFVGDGARGNIAAMTNSAAIGNRALVSAENAIVLGSVAGINGATEQVNVGIGITNPTHRLYIRDGAGSGVNASGNSLLVLDKTSGPNYLSILNGNTFESGLIFARSGSNQPPFDGGIFYNVSNTPGGMQFRNQGGLTRMVIHENGNISFGTNTNPARFFVALGTPSDLVPFGNSTLVLDGGNSSHYLNMISNGSEQGLLFGNNLSSRDGGLFYSATDRAFNFRTANASNRMVIDNLGRIGVGTAAPAFRLHVVTIDAQNLGFREGILVENTATGVSGGGISNTGEATISFKNAGAEGTGSNQWIVGLNQNRNLTFGYGDQFDASATRMVLDSTGRLGIGVSSPTFQLQLSTNSAAKPGSNTWTVSSDERLKKDMKPFEDGLETLEKINPIWFTYTGAENHPQEQFVGATAQAIQQIAPYMITTLKEHSEVGDKLLGVDYGPLQFIMVNAIKEQQQLIQQQQKQINVLMKRLEALEQKK